MPEASSTPPRQVIACQFEHRTDAAEFKSAHRPGIELYRAHLVRHAFDPHIHAAYGIGVIESGVERFRYAGVDHLAPAQSLVLMNPQVVHTGRAETAQGWRYRMVYIDADVLRAASGDRDWWFDKPVVHDRHAATHVSALLGGLWNGTEGLALDGQLSLLLEILRPHARGAAAAAVASPAPSVALERAIALMHDALATSISLEQLAHEAGLSPFHFHRQFSRRHGATPHQMLMALRMLRAKQLLAAGTPPAAVAAEVGLVDQAHLTRRFARMYGVTPARYQQQLGTRPARRA